VNQAEGVTVTEITFKNRAVKSALYKPNFMPQEEGWFKDEKYYPVNFEGTKDPEQAQARAYRHEIYSYRNTTMDPDSIPVLTLKYTETDSEGKTVTRTHDVKFIDPKAPAGTPLAINANYLYTITLTKAYKLEFNLTVEDWNEAETFNVPDLTVELDPSVQDSLNKALLVYDLFASNIVKSLTYATDDQPATATLYDEYLPSTEYPLETYVSWKTLNSKGLCGNDEKSYIYVNNEPYKLPTRGQLQLLTVYSPERDSISNRPAFTGSSYKFTTTEPFDEVVYLRNDNEAHSLETSDFSDESIAFKGESQLKSSADLYSFHIKEVMKGTRKLQSLCTQAEATSSLTRYCCYGVRFKGTNQCAAYKWQVGLTDGKGFYNSIKIKALPNKGEGIDVYDITDNLAFWKEGTYFEIKIPISGDVFYNGTTGVANTTTSYLNTSTIEGSSYYLFFSFGTSSSFLNGTKADAGFPLLLVKAKE
ncbi:MAG: hypothetical protein K2M29_06470, partial [Paramuribaculum sp.]|nr:hypothetical protein [Paramuribaculum sp.]